MTNEDVTRIERDLGRLVMRLPMIAASLGHSTVQDSLPYLHPSRKRPEICILMDILAEVPVVEICEKYYGSVDEALDAYILDFHTSCTSERREVDVGGI